MLTRSSGTTQKLKDASHSSLFRQENAVKTLGLMQTLCRTYTKDFAFAGDLLNLI